MSELIGYYIIRLYWLFSCVRCMLSTIFFARNSFYLKSLCCSDISLKVFSTS